jgi:hypothetical protein
MESLHQGRASWMGQSCPDLQCLYFTENSRTPWLVAAFLLNTFGEYRSSHPRLGRHRKGFREVRRIRHRPRTTEFYFLPHPCILRRSIPPQSMKPGHPGKRTINRLGKGMSHRCPQLHHTGRITTVPQRAVTPSSVGPSDTAIIADAKTPDEATKNYVMPNAIPQAY